MAAAAVDSSDCDSVPCERFKKDERGRRPVQPRLIILSRGPRLYSTRRLHEEANAAGWLTDVVDPMSLSIVVGDDDAQVLREGWPIHADAVIPRIGYSITQRGVRVVRQFERMGVHVTNRGDAILRSRDKLTASQILTAHDLPVPLTAQVNHWRDVERAIHRIGGVPCVVKVSEGTQGSGVFLVRTIREARELVWSLLDRRETVLVQQYIQESHGRDVRIIVVGGEVVAAMRRSATGREFRSNFHLGGTVEAVRLPDEYERVARRAARVLGLDVAGVDLLEGRDGPMVLEANSSPGLEGIEGATGVNVAARIIDNISRQHRFGTPRLDEVMARRRGHGIVSISLDREPALIGRSIADLGPIRDAVLTVLRGADHIYRPADHLVLQPSDEIVFYGDLQRIRGYLSGDVRPDVAAAAGSPAEPAHSPAFSDSLADPATYSTGQTSTGPNDGPATGHIG